MDVSKDQFSELGEAYCARLLQRIVVDVGRRAKSGCAEEL